MANQNFRVKNGLEVGVGGTILYAEDTGNVGIGTDNPSIYAGSANKFVVANTDGGTGITIATNSTSYGRIFFADGTTGSEAYRGVIQYNHTSDSLEVKTADSISLNIDSSGNTTFTGTANPTIDITGTSGSAIIKSSDRDLNYDARYGTHVWKNNGTEQVRINSSGNVGIGTDNPSQKLDVNGAARFRGAIYDNNNAVGAANSVLSSTGSGVQWVSVAAGSDADTLDGLDSSQFLRSDTDDDAQGFGSRANINTTGDPGLLITSGGRLGFDQSGTRSWTIKATGGNLAIASGDSSGSLTYNSNTVWHAGNDGTGSGLDADTVDGIQASSFLRSDASDVSTGNIAFNGTLATFDPPGGGTGTDTATDVALGLASGHRIVGWSDGYIRTLLEWNGSSDIEIGQSGTSLINGINLLPGSSGVAKVNGNTIWHAGNDGTGSGLDADTLDGIDSGSFLRSDTADTSSRMISFYTNMNSSEDWANSPISIRERDVAGAGDGEDRDSPNLNFHWSGRASKSLWMGANGYLNWGEYNASGVPAADGTLRSGNFLVSSSNYQVWHTGNDGSGSGLDADTLDGIDSGSFLRSDAVDTFTGSYLIFQSTNDAKLQLKCPSGDSSDWNYIEYYGRNGTRDGYVGTDASGILYLSQDGGSRLEMSTTSGTAYLNGNKIWTQGNDGSGSGLDADTLDGINSGSFLRSDAADSYTGTQLTFTSTGVAAMHLGAEGWQVSSSDAAYQRADARDDATNYSRLHWYGVSDGGSTSNFRHAYYDGSSYIDVTASSSTLNFQRESGTVVLQVHGNTVWHAGSDGSGSGLDADLLDGYHANSGNVVNTIVQRDGSGNFSANNITAAAFYPSGSTNSGRLISGGGWGMRVQTNDGYIQFGPANTSWAHIYTDRGGFYFNTTNLQANSNTIWHAGNDGSGSGLDADLLDGINSGSFLRSDADDTLTGNLQINSHVINMDLNNINDNAIELREIRDSTWPFQFVSNDVGNDNASGFWVGSNGYPDMRLRRDDGTVRALISSWETSYVSNGFNINGSTAWHAGNDGSGSGLDADLWDGNQFSSYLNQAVLTTSSPTFTNVYVNDWFRNNVAAEGLYNQATNSHFYSAGANYWHINSNSTSNAALIFYSAYNSTQGNATNRKGYVYWDSNGFGLLSNNGSWAYRHDNTYADIFGTIRQGGSNTVWHAGNDGSGSGLDADLLDGINSGSFLRSDAADTATGTLTVRDIKLSAGYHLQRSDHHSGHLEGSYNSVGENSYKTNPIYSIGSSYNPNDNTLNNFYGIGYSHTNASFINFTGASGWGMYVAADGDARIYLSASNGVISSTGDHYVGSSKVWHTGNDGAGSGLDADNLDGYTWASSGKQIRASDFYADNWFRNYNSSEGLFNEANVMYWYSDSNTTYRIRSNQGSVRISFATSSNTTRAYLYADTASSIGFLNTGGQWGLRYLSNDGNSPNWYFREEANETWTGNPGSDVGKIEYHSNRFYIVAGSNSTYVCQFRRDGSDVCRVENNGSIVSSGTVTANSDIKLKTNIKTIDNAIAKVLQLRGVEYDRLDMDNEHQIGVIAQEVEKVIPEVVKDNVQYDPETGEKDVIKSVNYGNMVALLIEAIKEQDNKINELQKKIEKLISQ